MEKKEKEAEMEDATETKNKRKYEMRTRKDVKTDPEKEITSKNESTPKRKRATKEKTSDIAENPPKALNSKSPSMQKSKQSKAKKIADEEKPPAEDLEESGEKLPPKKKAKIYEAKKKADSKKAKADKSPKKEKGKVENGDVAKEEIKQEKKKAASKKRKNKVEDSPVPRPTKYESLGDGPSPVPSTGHKYMGCHVSGAGGVWNAFENAEDCSAKSFALFLRSQRQWAAKPLDDATVEKWKKISKDLPPHLVLPHGSYLMNLGSSNKETLDKSRALLVEELKRCQRLGIPHFNFHPGSTLGQLSRLECCKLIAEGINQAHEQTEGVICVLENMCCQGFTIGGDFHELRAVIEHVKDRTRVGVCLDTCHAHAAGYDLATKEGFQKLLDDFERIIGWQFLRGLHINDSKGKAGDNLDRHEIIGKGTIGLDGFRRVMNCSHFNDLPLILETPYTSNDGYAKEIKILEGLIEK